MAKLSLVRGTASKLLRVFIQDSTSTSGAGLIGLVFDTSGLTAYYIIEGAASMTAITLATMTVGTWATGGFKEVDATNAPGLYEIGVPNLAIASGASVVIYLQGAANMVPCVAELELTAVNNQVVNSYGLAATGMDAVVMSDITAVPAMTGSVKAAINWMFALMRNKRTETATVETLFKDDGSTAVATSTKSDASGTFTRGEFS